MGRDIRGAHGVYILMTSAAQRAASHGNRVKAFLLYALVSIVIVFAGLKITFAVEGKWGHDAFIRWGGLAAFTIGLFGLFMGDSEKFLRKWRFWGVTSILLTGHLAVFAIVLTHVEEWKLMWFMVMVVEYPLFLFLRDRFVGPVLG